MRYVNAWIIGFHDVPGEIMARVHGLYAPLSEGRVLVEDDGVLTSMSQSVFNSRFEWLEDDVKRDVSRAFLLEID